MNIDELAHEYGLSKCKCHEDFKCTGHLDLELAFVEGSTKGQILLWEVLHSQKPTLHFCPEMDLLLIDDKDPEFENCLCTFITH